MIQVHEVVAVEDPPTVQFRVVMEFHAIQPPSDGDGELYNQRVGAEILKQVVQQLLEDEHA